MGFSGFTRAGVGSNIRGTFMYKAQMDHLESSTMRIIFNFGPQGVKRIPIAGEPPRGILRRKWNASLTMSGLIDPLDICGGGVDALSGLLYCLRK